SFFIIGFRSNIDQNGEFTTPTHQEEYLIWDKWVSGEYWKRHNLPVQIAKEKLLKKVDKIRHKYRLSSPQSQPWVTVRDALYGLPEM
ncbi:hypothetical protein, partial [Pseudoalteromonas sp. S558]|uniref:hypothetical protein n=1 Tax=Pseudoalteromonas sp. S558 TaxID=2066515 RepID=UPI00126AB45B